MERGMRKCTASVIYSCNLKAEEYQIYSLAVTYKGHLFNLLRYDKEAKPEPYKYNSFERMYESVLNIMKNNHFYPGFYREFDRRWYDIQWINMYDFVVDQYGLPYRKEEEECQS